MNKIILEDRFTTHQKITFLLYIGAPFIIVIIALLRKALNSSLNHKGYLALLIFLIFYAVLISIAFLKRGFIKINSNLYRGSFFREKLFFKKRIDISKTHKVAVCRLGYRNMLLSNSKLQRYFVQTQTFLSGVEYVYCQLASQWKTHQERNNGKPWNNNSSTRYSLVKIKMGRNLHH